jgi:hypothetical protein
LAAVAPATAPLPETEDKNSPGNEGEGDKCKGGKIVHILKTKKNSPKPIRMKGASSGWTIATSPATPA